jgi:hypothetical protein
MMATLISGRLPSLTPQHHYGWILLVLWIFFCLRVLGQMLVMFFRVRFLPPATAWFSGLMPYPQLLLSQIAIILFYGKACLDVYAGRNYFGTPNSALGKGLLIFGSLYLGLMLLRYLIRMGLYPEERWVGGCIPIFFHWVLSSFVLVLGSYHWLLAPGAHQPIDNSVVPLGLAAILVWALYQLAPSLLAFASGLGRARFAVRPQKDVSMPSLAGSATGDVYHPLRPDTSPALLLGVAGASGLGDTMVAGIVAKMFAERGCTVVLRKARKPVDREMGAGWAETVAWVKGEQWCDGVVRLSQANSASELLRACSRSSE